MLMVTLSACHYIAKYDVFFKTKTKTLELKTFSWDQV